jgi:hypothetical protein
MFYQVLTGISKIPVLEIKAQSRGYPVCRAEETPLKSLADSRICLLTRLD